MKNDPLFAHIVELLAYSLKPYGYNLSVDDFKLDNTYDNHTDWYTKPFIYLQEVDMWADIYISHISADRINLSLGGFGISFLSEKSVSDLFSYWLKELKCLSKDELMIKNIIE
jgi:hypothetical protein